MAKVGFHLETITTNDTPTVAVYLDIPAGTTLEELVEQRDPAAVWVNMFLKALVEHSGSAHFLDKARNTRTQH